MSHSDLHFPHLGRLPDAAASFGAAEHSPPRAHDSNDPSAQDTADRADVHSGYGALEVAGADAAVFLNGQLTTDVITLAVGQCQTSALCNLKGRVIAQFELAHIEPERFLLITRQTLIDTLLNTLRRYVLRSKVTLNPLESASNRFILTQSPHPCPSGTTRTDGNRISCRPAWLPADEPQWIMSNEHSSAERDDARHRQPEPNSLPDLSWAHAHVLTGIAPPVTGSELEHIPQMLNLDALNGVSVTKGCYTGQEIISRVHHRGSVKRRLRRFSLDPVRADRDTPDVAGSVAHAEPCIGDPVTTSSDATAGVVVEVATGGGRTGVLAVVKESAFTEGEMDSSSGLECNGTVLAHWPLPYPV